jgi:hypothetical protein
MAAAVDSLISLAPSDTAPEISDYPQFALCEAPAESDALRAFRGFIRPFSDDQTAREVLRAMEADIPLQISGGRLSVETVPERKHPFEAYLTAMSVPFTIMVLEFGGTEHPRAFIVSPRMLMRLSQCPHIRTDKSILIDGRPEPALCVYSGSIFQSKADKDRLEQFLDQTATYLAKYLTWLRTRMLFRPTGGWTREFVFKRKPNEPVTETDLIFSPDIYWDGYWPGRSAPSGPAQHLASIKRTDECWCWSGKIYGECCRPKDIARNKRAGGPV